MIDELREAYPTVNVQSVLNICERFNTIYVTNQKAGCSTIKLFLYKAQTGDHDVDPRNVHIETKLPSPSEVGMDRVNRMLKSDGFVFSFVRNPIDRILSAYSDKIVPQKPAFFGPVRDYLRSADDEPITLIQFLDYLRAQKPEDLDHHYRPQHINLMIDKMRYDFIGKLENFSVDFNHILSEAGIPVADVVHRNKRKRRAEASPEAEASIREIYARDFEIFGY